MLYWCIYASLTLNELIKSPRSGATLSFQFVSAAASASAAATTFAYHVKTHDLDLACFKVKFRNSSISGIVGLIDVKWKGSELIWYWADCMTLLFDHIHDLDLGVSRSESEIALSQEWGGRLTWKEKDLSHPFMTMILTSVTMVRWADVLDSDWGDFRRRHAIDISSYELCYIWQKFCLGMISWKPFK